MLIWVKICDRIESGRGASEVVRGMAGIFLAVAFGRVGVWEQSVLRLYGRAALCSVLYS